MLRVFCRYVITMDDNEPPPPYSSIDEFKDVGFPPTAFYTTGSTPQNQYGATSCLEYPELPSYQEPSRSDPGVASSSYPHSGEPQPTLLLAPSGTRLGRAQWIQQRYSTYCMHMMLSCFVICCCGPGGFACGLLAFFVASMLLLLLFIYYPGCTDTVW